MPETNKPSFEVGDLIYILAHLAQTDTACASNTGTVLEVNLPDGYPIRIRCQGCGKRSVIWDKQASSRS